MEQKKSPEKRIPKLPRMRKYAWAAVKLVLALHAGTQVNYCVTGSRDSPQRTAFEREFGFSVQGFKEDLEDENQNLSKIASAVHKEQLEKQFHLSAIRVSSEHYWRKSIPGQLEHIVIKGGEAYDGINYPFAGRIYLDDDFSIYTVNHEIKHAKTDWLMLHHPEFEKKWLASTLDAEGNSPYSGYSSKILPRIRLIGDYFEGRYFDSTENEKLGFVSSYARICFYEDVAELSEMAEKPYSVYAFARLLYEDKNEKIIHKVNLAQEYGLIPAEFSEYVAVQKAFNENKELADASDALLDLSGDFLARHPNSVYEIIIRGERGKILEKKEQRREAVEEYRLGLKAEYKDPNYYSDIISSISGCYEKMGDNEMAALYQKAKEIYEAGWKNNDLEIVLRGVDGFLEENGERI
ncbi:MAG: hypothetical protein AABX64_02325 [Nanoarchaeota archaeon]